MSHGDFVKIDEKTKREIALLANSTHEDVISDSLKSVLQQIIEASEDTSLVGITGIPEFMTTREAAKALGVSHKTFIGLVDSHEIPLKEFKENSSTRLIDFESVDFLNQKVLDNTLSLILRD